MPHSRPAKGKDVACSKCIAPNTNLLTVGFNDPLAGYAGRYVDSVNTRNVQNIGMRTVRAQRVRVNYARQRIFVKYGETVAAFPISLFFTNIANPDLWPVGCMNTGSKVSRYGDPIEIVAKPSTFFYAEAKGSGWSVTPQDMQVTLTDFDSDDTGNVFTGSYSWGWGIAWDQNDYPDCRQMEFRCQVADCPIVPNSVFYLKPDAIPYAVVSASVASSSASSLIIYDVTSTTAPVLKETRVGKPNFVMAWARYDASKRLAAICGDGNLRIHDYATFIAGGKELASFTPASKKTFRDLSFDENGTLWVVESGTSAAAGNKLWQLTPAGNTYTAVQHDVYGSAFAPQRVAARKGWIAVAGSTSSNTTELRLYALSGGKPVSRDTANFFFKYYHDKQPPAGYCTASTYTPSYCALDSLHILEWEGKNYLLYSANGLGDVYQL